MNNKLNIYLAVSLFMVLTIPVCVLHGQNTFTSTTGPYKPKVVKDITSSKVSSTETIYAADVETLKYSTNGGTSWLVTGTAMLNPIVVASNPTDTSIVHVGKLGSLERTTNGGSTWESPSKISDANLVPLRLADSPSSTNYWLLGADTVLRGSTWTTSVYRTTDAGVNWQAVTYFRDNAHTNANDVTYHPGTNKAYVGGSRLPLVQTPDASADGSPVTKGVWYSSDGGVNWSFKPGTGSNLLGGGSTHRNVSALALSDGASSDVLFAAVTKNDAGTTKAILYQSVDDGANWTLSADLYSQIGATQVRAMKASSVDENDIIAATDKGFAISTNRGVNWSLQNTGLADVYKAYQVLFDKNDGTGNTAYIATDPTVYKTTNQGSSWTGDNGIFTWLNSIAIAINNGNAHAVAQAYSRIARYTSSAWEKVPKLVGQNSFSAEAVAINPLNTSYANACGDSATYGVIYTRTDGANGWNKVFTSSNSNTKIYAVAPDYKSGSQRVHAGGKFNVSGTAKNYAYSTDRGVSWSNYGVIGSDGTIQVNTFAIDSTPGGAVSYIIYAGLGSGTGVRKSTDYGTTWPTSQLNGNSIVAIALNVASASTVYLSSTTGVWKSTDKLATAPDTVITSYLGAKRLLMHPSYLTSANYVWRITGDGQQIYKTADGGASWSEISTSSLTKPLNDLQKDPTSNALIYVATAAGVYKINPAPESPNGFNVTGSNCTPCFESLGPCYAKPYWSASPEADIASTNRYQVQRWSDVNPTPVTVYIGNATDYTDTQVELLCSGSHWAYYHVRAKDAAGNYSDYTLDKRVRASVVPSVTAIRRDAREETTIYTFRLLQNTPNPFNPVTQIQYSLAENVHVTLKIYDIVGREVAILVDETQNAGLKTVKFNASNLPSSVYFYRLTAGSFSDTKKLLLMK